MAPTPRDRRRFPRYDTDCQVLAGEYRFPNLRAKGWTLDIGPQGCRMLSDESLKPGIDLRMVLLIRGKLVLLGGRVMHERCHGDAEYEVGVEFRNVRPYARSVLDALSPSSRASTESVALNLRP